MPPTKRKPGKVSLFELILNKIILLIIAGVIGIFTVIGYNFNILIGAVFMALFMAIVGVIIDLPALKNWIDENLNNKDWDNK